MATTFTNYEPSETIRSEELPYLRSISGQYPDASSAIAEIAYCEAFLKLPKGTIHVLSDVHGEDKKLQHVIHNASGSLRPTVEALFNDRRSPQEITHLLTFIYYPKESFERARAEYSDPQALKQFLHGIVLLEFEVMREVAKRYSVRRIERTFPPEYADLFRELFFERESAYMSVWAETMLSALFAYGKEFDFLRRVSRAIRNLSIAELIVAGDFGDRGPRIDRVIERIMYQPNVAITWGNHDVTWMGACLGSELLIATVIRISLRYRRLAQVEEGYGITMAPLEKLARTCYGHDPAERFRPRGEGLREEISMARMQKAMAIIEFKLEGQAIERNPDFHMDHRNLLRKLDIENHTIEVGSITHPLLDSEFPTIDPADPLALSPEEQACMDRIRRSFLASDKLWKQMLYLKSKGAMYLIRADNLIFHGCLAVDEEGNHLPMMIDGRAYAGKSLMEKLNLVVQRAFKERRQEDFDVLYYLWAGANSPLFGKDKMATFERYFLADPDTHEETKNSYFRLIHESEFCQKILAEFGVDPDTGLIVNGHVPVKVEQGEDPVKQSGKAITIDGAFSEAYGDHGYTLILESKGTYLARHSHFDSVEEAVASGTEIIPQVTCIKEFAQELTVGGTEEGAASQAKVDMLKKLVQAFEENLIEERG